MTGILVHCDACGWEDRVSTIRHLRAWYRAACPECGQGELIDATEVRLAEEMMALETRGLVRVHDGSPLRPNEVVAHINTAAEHLFSVPSTDTAK